MHPGNESSRKVGRHEKLHFKVFFSHLNAAGWEKLRILIFLCAMRKFFYFQVYYNSFFSAKLRKISFYDSQLQIEDNQLIYELLKIGEKRLIYKYDISESLKWIKNRYVELCNVCPSLTTSSVLCKFNNVTFSMVFSFHESVSNNKQTNIVDFEFLIVHKKCEDFALKIIKNVMSC